MWGRRTPKSWAWTDSQLRRPASPARGKLKASIALGDSGRTSPEIEARLRPQSGLVLPNAGVFTDGVRRRFLAGNPLVTNKRHEVGSGDSKPLRRSGSLPDGETSRAAQRIRHGTISAVLGSPNRSQEAPPRCRRESEDEALRDHAFAKDFDDVYLTVQRAVGAVKEGQAQCRRCLAMFAAPGALDFDPDQIGSFTSKRILRLCRERLVDHVTMFGR